MLRNNHTALHAWPPYSNRDWREAADAAHDWRIIHVLIIAAAEATAAAAVTGATSSRRALYQCVRLSNEEKSIGEVALYFSSEHVINPMHYTRILNGRTDENKSCM